MKNILRTLGAFALSIVVLTAGHEIVMADGPYFHRVITQSIEFRQDESTLPAAGTAYIARDGSGELTINVLTGQSFNVAVNAVDVAVIDVTGFVMAGNSLSGVGFISLTADTEPAGTLAYINRDNTDDVSVNVPTGGLIALQVNAVDIVQADVTGFVMGGNSISGSGFISLTADTNPAGTVAFISRDNTDDITVNVPTGGLIQLAVNVVDEYSFSATQFDLQANEILDAQLLNLTDGTTLTLDAPGAVTVTQTLHVITAITGQTTDSLVTINGGAAGDILILGAADTDDIFVDVDGGNISGTDRNLFEVGDRIMFVFDGSSWREISFSDNE